MSGGTATSDSDDVVEDSTETLTPFQQMFGSAWKQGQSEVRQHWTTPWLQVVENVVQDRCWISSGVTVQEVLLRKIV